MKKRCKKKLRYMRRAYAEGTMDAADVRQVVASYRGHLQHGHTRKLLRKLLGEWPGGFAACGGGQDARNKRCQLYE